MVTNKEMLEHMDDDMVADVCLDALGGVRALYIAMRFLCETKEEGQVWTNAIRGIRDHGLQLITRPREQIIALMDEFNTEAGRVGAAYRAQDTSIKPMIWL